jgi:hypothetical protein
MITKKSIDELAELKLKVEALQAQVKEATKLYEKALTPVLAFVATKATPDQGLQLSGVKMLLEFGKQRAVRKLLSPVEALLKLEKVEKGLGYSHISIPVSVLDKYLRPAELEGLFETEYGARSVSVTKLG